MGFWTAPSDFDYYGETDFDYDRAAVQDDPADEPEQTDPREEDPAINEPPSDDEAEQVFQSVRALWQRRAEAWALGPVSPRHRWEE